MQYQAPGTFGRAFNEPDQMTPFEFRLHPKSPGKGAAKDGRDLGADVDLVGPGEAYERWKKTPQYQEWLKEIAASSKDHAP